MPTFSAIIPAYNEEARIGDLLKNVLDCNLLDEIIIINDGSTDATKQEILKQRDTRIHCIDKPQNEGKLRAVFDGIALAKGTHIVMIDADYIGFRGDFLSQMIVPIQNNAVDTTMMMWKNSMWICKIMKHDIFSGTRVLPKEIFENKQEYLSGKGFSLEVKINEKIVEGKLRVQSFYFPEIHNPSKGWYQIFVRQPIHILSSHSLWKIWKHMLYIYKQQK